MSVYDYVQRTPFHAMTVQCADHNHIQQHTRIKSEEQMGISVYVQRTPFHAMALQLARDYDNIQRQTRIMID